MDIRKEDIKAVVSGSNTNKLSKTFSSTLNLGLGY
jgi:hypothetical protein